MITAIRYHDISCGHRVVGHESKCAHLHGHNYRIHFHVASINDDLDEVGRVIDFSVIKSLLCQWLEEKWDHKMLIWDQDPLKNGLSELDPSGVVLTAFNPTAENMATYLVAFVGPMLLRPHDVTLIKVVIEETRKCSVEYELES